MQTIIDLAAHRVPIVSERRAWAQAGALFTYAADGLDLSRRTAKQVAKILGGFKPGDLPIEQADKFDFIVNLKTAREVQITIPNSILARADEIIR